MKKTIIGISALVAIVLVAYAFLFLPKPNVSAYTTTPAQTMNLEQVVNADGTVTADTEVDLGFQLSGQISAINVRVGDTVTKGQVLASLDRSSLNAQLAAAQAALSGAQANLANNQTTTAISYSNAQKSAIAAVTDAYTKVENAIQNDTDTFFSNPQSLANPKFLITTQTQSQERQIETEDVAVHQALVTWNTEINTGTTSAETLLADTKGYLATVTSFLTDVSTAVNASAQQSQTSQANITANLTTLNAATSLVAAAQTEITNASNTLSTDTPQSVAALEAAVNAAQANISGIQAQISEAVIVAPVSGVVTAQTGNVGEAISSLPPTPIIHLISSNPYQVDAYVSEASVATISVGQDATVTLEAYGTSATFPATVISVDQGQTTVNGVGMYKVTLQFDQTDARIRDGMSATATIITSTQNNVLAVPTSALLNNNTTTSVIVVDATHRAVATTVEPGIVGVNASSTGSWTQITSGLSAGQNVVTFGDQYTSQ